MDEMIKSKKELMLFLNERKDYFINEERNPFTEMRMVCYINDGISKLNNIKVSDETLVTMYESNGALQFKVAE